MSSESSSSPLMKFFWRSEAPTVAERCRRRVALHLIPYLFFLYILAYLDRVNVSVAKLGMQLDPSQGGLGFNDEVIGIGSGMFFWGYWILEIPSTLTVLKHGARWVFVRILVFWGLACILIGFIGLPLIDNLLGWLTSEHKYQFYFLRFMLGFFEGGFFPSVIVYLSLWFRPQDRAKAIAAFMIAIPISNVFGAPLSGYLLDLNMLDMPGWRWVFILQGAVPVLAGFVTIYMLPNRPTDAHWLPEDEKAWLVGELEREHAQTAHHGHWEWTQQAGIVLLFTLAYFLMNTASYGLQFFMPTIIKDRLGVSSTWASILTALPFVMAFFGMITNAWHSDKKQERIWHTAGVMIVSGTGLTLAAALSAVDPVLAFLSMTLIMGPCLFAWLPAYWPMPRKLMGATAAASAVGFINMIGNLGGGTGSWLVGTLSTMYAEEAKETGSNFGLTLAMFALGALPLLASLVILTIGRLRREQLQAPPAPAPEAPLPAAKD